MILDPHKCHYMYFGKDAVNDLLQLCVKDHKASEFETGLGIETDNKLIFENYVKLL